VNPTGEQPDTIDCNNTQPRTGPVVVFNEICTETSHMTPIKIISLGYMGVNVTDFGAWRQFAGDLLALQTVTVAEHYRALRLDDRAQRDNLQKAEHDGAAYYCFEVADAAA
jgi:hypothetical protein